MPKPTLQHDLLRVASLQYELRPVSSFEEFAAQASCWVANAADYKARLVLFPEYFSLQLLSLIEDGGDGGKKTPLPQLVRAVAGHADRFDELFVGLARRHSITVVAGTLPVLSEGNGGRVFNECRVYSASGVRGAQQKLHMTRFEKEDFLVSPALPAKLRIFEADWGKFAVAICYDVEFPDVARAAALEGVQLLLVPSCTDDRQGYYRVRHCAQARAVENQIYVIQASTVGGLSKYPAACLNYGQAAILTPCDYGFARDGILAEGIVGTESMVVGDLDLALLERSRSAGTVLPLQDSRDSGSWTSRTELVELVRI